MQPVSELGRRPPPMRVCGINSLKPVEIDAACFSPKLEHGVRRHGLVALVADNRCASNPERVSQLGLLELPVGTGLP